MAIVASVGPYRFSTIECVPAFCHSCAYDVGRGSPQKKLYRREGKVSGSRSFILVKTLITDGTENQAVNALSRMNLAGSRTALSGRQYKQDPHSQARKMS